MSRIEENITGIMAARARREEEKAKEKAEKIRRKVERVQYW